MHVVSNMIPEARDEWISNQKKKLARGSSTNNNEFDPGIRSRLRGVQLGMKY